MPRTRTTTTTAFTPLHSTHHLTPYHTTPTALRKHLHRRFGLHNAGLSGFWREWASGCIVAQCDEGVFMFAHGFGYACLVSVQVDKAVGIIRGGGVRDVEMEGAWRRGGKVYDGAAGGEWPGDGGERGERGEVVVGGGIGEEEGKGGE
ncbi:hypothetical protein P167DRAFT_572949 [Morchella conica CCBAS932]|uniref:Uncharacterized protein n=1 Tax=Morchella conica CCBAS932 TaxID=1392247 RepID=A0A3N4KU41_9PEZI|nr:hypothetical protein P167DRAFT_572949 [Morchella conica CCBAS932]